jgi:DNA-binding PucR family transcriptional regulator
LAAALAQARHAHTYARDRQGPARVVASGELAFHDLLLANVAPQARRAFADQLLAPLHRYDAEHHSQLVHTLHTFLSCDCSWIRAAAKLHLHVNTLRHRIRRAEAITGRNLDHFTDRVDLFLAMRCASS